MREPAIGDQVDQYRLDALIARSGFATLFRATDGESGAAVVVKIPHFDVESDVSLSQRFQREEELGQRLDHPGLVKVLRPQVKSRVYLVMEYVEGETLRQRIDRCGPLRADEVVGLGRQLCEVLAALHAEGVAHRDLKPENLIVTPQGRLKLLDLGIARDRRGRRLTWTGLSRRLGTPDYMAPEQIRGERGGPRTDVYAAGTVLYELLCGKLPFTAQDTLALLEAKVSRPPVLPRAWVQGLDPSLEAVLLRALAGAPRDRQADGAELLADLRDPAGAAQRAAAAGARRPAQRWLRPLVVGAVLAALFSLVRATAQNRPEPGTHVAAKATRSR